MAAVRWTLQALADVDAICEFIARDAPRTAKRFGQRLFQAVEPLERFPRSGRIVPELRREDVRELRLKRYRIIYRILDEETVEVLTVYHGSRSLDLDILDLE
ncbi:MAG: type II toxin-antitoxin system RelE/ParE family toxin [bacterium]|nr:type II toxin-antitoxin system RelE/ParE family toxin [bacterium]